MRQYVRGFAGFVVFLAACCSAGAQQVPQELRPPSNEQLLLQVHAKGDQIYTCKQGVTQFAWTLKGPEAQLTDKDGKPFGKHYAGPSWEANDGSRITGKAAANAPSPDNDSIPWLLLDATSNTGTGTFGKVASIQRLHTQGGKAPAEGCDAGHATEEARIPYQADYYFYVPH